MDFFKKYWRWFKFHLIYKRKFSKTHGIPTLCDNLNHPYHESKFEQNTCSTLSTFFKDDEVLVPSNHKYKIKFDFVIFDHAVIEPHGIWSSSPDENNYFSYYDQRKKYANEEKNLKTLPLVVLTNEADLRLLKNKLIESKNYKKTFFDVSKELLEKYMTNTPNQQPELLIQLINSWLILMIIISLLLNGYFIINFYF